MSSDSSEAAQASDGQAEEWSGNDEGSSGDAQPAFVKGTKRDRLDTVETDGVETLKAKKSRKKAKKKRKDFDAERTVFAGKIPYVAEEDDIRTFFSECGAITRLRMLLVNNKFNGAVFVEFATAGMAIARACSTQRVRVCVFDWRSHEIVCLRSGSQEGARDGWRDVS